MVLGERAAGVVGMDGVPSLAGGVVPSWPVERVGSRLRGRRWGRLEVELGAGVKGDEGGERVPVVEAGVEVKAAGA